MPARFNPGGQQVARPSCSNALPAALLELASTSTSTLPTNDPLHYEVYHFATRPAARAQLPLPARSATKTETRLISLAAIVAAAIVLWIALKLVRRGALGWFRHPLGAASLLIAGIALLCYGVLLWVVAALAAIFAGMGLLIVRG